MEGWSPQTKLRTGLCRLDSFGRIVSIWNWPDELQEVPDRVEDAEPIHSGTACYANTEAAGQLKIPRRVSQGESSSHSRPCNRDSQVEGTRWFDPLRIFQSSEFQDHGGIMHIPLVDRLHQMYLAPLSAILMTWHLRSLREISPTPGVADLHHRSATESEDYADLPALEGPDNFKDNYKGLPNLERVRYDCNHPIEFACCPLCDSSKSHLYFRGHDLRVSRMWSNCIDAGAAVLIIHALGSTFGFPENTLVDLVDSVMEVYHASITAP